ncbi:Tetratricopeptide repeat protein 34 [Larimichthys crocea]|uniref:Tetratricopeptide repeat protein 34 n=1 Tax=Larimichthys crocea TaxID=215358 RepID=A0A6G0IQ13_LARCR|nr:Tetratricopeptide repeat protein 34 [Larimichthys crocea]
MTAVVRPGDTVSELCEEADKFLEAGELGRATSLYMSAFRTHAASTVSHMRKMKSSLGAVISTLEGWLDGNEENQPAEGLNKGLAAVFLSTLCPNNLSATIFKMESLLQSGGHGCEEIFARCTALLDGKRNSHLQGATSMVLEITRALACLLSEPHSIKGLKLYLKAYQNNKLDTVTLIKNRQAQHLPKIVRAFTDQGWLLASISVSRQKGACLLTEKGFSSAQTCGPLMELSCWTPVITQLRTLCHLEPDGGGRELRCHGTTGGCCLLFYLSRDESCWRGLESTNPRSSTSGDSQQENQLQAPTKRENHRSGTPAGVQSLAVLLMELQPTADGSQILAADALYQLGRVEEAYRLLLSVGPISPRAPILARLALLQLHRGFLYDTNQLLKKLIQCGDTSCLRPLLAVARPKDRGLLQAHCHSAAKRILEATREERAVREAVAYLSIAIMASGGEAADSLLERGRCYVLLGQRKTAIFDFSAILKEHPKHVQALCGRGFTYLVLNQQKECTQDILAALQISTDIVIKDILSLKDKARKLVCDWLHQFCRANLSDILIVNAVPCHEEHLREAFIIGGALMRTDCRDPRWHLLYVDILLAKGEVKAAGAHLCQVFGQEPRDAVAQARVGVVEAWQQNYRSAARRLSKLTEKDSSSLDFLLALIPFNQRKHMAQAAAQEASSVASVGQWDQAVTLLTVAVQAVGNHRLQYLRQRAACLAQLGLHERAIADLDKVIQRHSDSSCSDDPQIWVEDLCRRGRSLVLCSREGAALEDFTQALELHKNRAIQCVEAGLGRLRVAECFLRGALQHYGEQQLDKAWTLIECGLVVDSENTELRRLRARVKREVASPCNVN